MHQIKFCNFFLDVVIDFLCCMSAKIETISYTPPSALNKKRIKRGKVPYFSYKILPVGPNHCITKLEEDANKGDLLSINIARRFHSVRGHLRRYKTGR